jgi:hypothetical protein
MLTGIQFPFEQSNWLNVLRQGQAVQEEYEGIIPQFKAT